MRDPYDVLGVRKAASAEEIKSAYRRLAKKLHPDANMKDPKTAQKFAELNSAYEIVGDEDKRKAFDRGEIDAEGKPRFHPGFEGAGAGRGFGGRDGHFETFSWGPDGVRRSAGRGGGSGFKVEDILGDMFGGFGMGARPRPGQPFEGEDFGRGQDVPASLTIALQEAAGGTSKRIPAGDRQGRRGEDSRRNDRRPADPPQGPRVWPAPPARPVMS